ncbi:hypothetical protein ISS07_06995 [Candidatus Woesearchaeota archaeon]|nr:hypothetical protein [Candidatus Woesearchaeota archaeon]
MSQASKQIEWCLSKAKKEIEECKKLGKRPKHRGLLLTTTNPEEAKKHLSKAEHNLNALIKFNQIGFSDWSMSAGFYALYHCFLSIAAKFGYESRNQTCTVALMRLLKEENKIKIDDRFIEMLEQEQLTTKNIINLREDYTYGVEISVKDESQLVELMELCKLMIDITKEIVFEVE